MLLWLAKNTLIQSYLDLIGNETTHCEFYDAASGVGCRALANAMKTKLCAIVAECGVVRDNRLFHAPRRANNAFSGCIRRTPRRIQMAA